MSCREVSSSDRFILPAASSKMRRVASFSAIHATSASVSPLPTPSSTNSPGPTWLTRSPSTVTEASRTRCTTAFISCSLPGEVVGAVERGQPLAAHLHVLHSIPREELLQHALVVLHGQEAAPDEELAVPRPVPRHRALAVTGRHPVDGLHAAQEQLDVLADHQAHRVAHRGGQSVR